MTVGNGTNAGDKLTTYSERMERLLDEIDGLKEDLKELKAEIKNDGFNVRALSKLVTIRRNKRTAEIEAELMNDLVLYAHATGTPLDLVMPEEELRPRRNREHATTPPPIADTRTDQVFFKRQDLYSPSSLPGGLVRQFFLLQSDRSVCVAFRAST